MTKPLCHRQDSKGKLGSPGTNRTGIEVDEAARVAIVAHAASTQGNGAFTQAGIAAASEADVDGLTTHVEAIACDALGSPAELGIGFGRAITAVDLNLAFLAVHSGLQVIQEIEQLGIHESGFMGVVIPEEMIQLGQGVPLVAVTDAVGDAQRFIGVGVAEVENASGFLGVEFGEDGCRNGGKGEAKKNPPVHAVTPVVIMVVENSDRIIRINMRLATK